MSDGIEKLKEEIVKKAREEASLIIRGAHSEASRLIKEAESKVDARRKESEEETKRSIESIKKRELITAGLESKKIELESKKKLIDGVFEMALEELKNLSDSKRQSILNSIHKKIQKEIEIGVLYCNRRDAKYLKNVETKDGETKAIDISGGLIAESKDGRIRVDYSFDTMLDSIKENSLKEIVDILFNEDELFNEDDKADKRD